MLWLCMDMPWLPLTIFERGGSVHGAFVVTENRHVLHANAAALRDGIRPGLSVSAAQALTPTLHQRERSREDEARALTQLAGWALQFTATVSLQPPTALLLEIGGSLRYFGGLEALRGHLRHELDTLGYRHVLGIAPTPTAAWLLARAVDETPITHGGELRARLGALPATTLPLDANTAQALDALGVETLEDCLALPRDGLARRLGPGLARTLDRALGDRPDPRRYWQAPPRYQSHLELPAETHDTEQLAFALNRMLRELTGFLHGIEHGARRFQIRLEHRNQAATPFSIGLLAPSRDPEHLLELTRQRLERIRLPAPVIALALNTRDIEPLAPETPALPGTGVAETGGDDPSALVERLGARLGDDTVAGLATRAEHRPELAWSYASPGTASAAERAPERPLWLLARPVPLDTDQGLPLWHGRLSLERGPERIESGWWDGQDVARDYYIAANTRGERVWVYQQRRGDRPWYLHGIFA